MSTGGLARFESELNAEVVSRVRGWLGVPGLRPLLESLEAQDSHRRFFDLWVEALVADRLHRRGCQLAVEVETPKGRTCDFRVCKDGVEWYLHVKRLHERGPRERAIAISPRLRVLEHIDKPFIVRIRWADGLPDELMQELVVRASAFLEMARLGDELTVRDETGVELGAVRVVAPWEGAHVSLAIGLPERFVDETQRIRRLLDRAYRQFMPKAENVILVVGTRPDESIDFESALLGASEERWDAHPTPDGRAPVGRAADGFWSGGSRPDSRICGWSWATAETTDLQIDLHLRDHRWLDEDVDRAVRELLGEDRTEN